MIKKSVVAGSFYPDNAEKIYQMIDTWFASLVHDPVLLKINKDNLFGVIVPHAGYLYSGKTAAYSYYLLSKCHFDNAIIIAPSHYSGYFDFSVSTHSEYETPLGMLNVNTDIVNELFKHELFTFQEIAEKKEHSLEVQLPFLKYINPNIRIVPIIFGNQNFNNAKHLAETLKKILQNRKDKSMIIISSDLSHFHNSETALKYDRVIIDFINKKQPEMIWENLIQHNTEACGFGGILSILHYAKICFDNYEPSILHYTNSGYITNDFNQVVAYMSCAFVKE